MEKLWHYDKDLTQFCFHEIFGDVSIQLYFNNFLRTNVLEIQKLTTSNVCYKIFRDNLIFFKSPVCKSLSVSSILILII